MQWTVKLGVQKQRCDFPPRSHSSSKKAWCAEAAFDSGSSKIRFLSFSMGRKHQLRVTHPWQSSLWEVLLFLGGTSLPWSPDLSLHLVVPLLLSCTLQAGQPNSPNPAVRTVHFRSFPLSNPPPTQCSCSRQSPLAAHSSPVFLPHTVTISCFIVSAAKRFSFAFFG